MSNALAIASVTAVLKNLLDNGMVEANSNGPVKVDVSPPDRVATGASEQAQLNLFLYSVAPNLGWRNAGLPSRDAQGQSVSSPPLALDLYYLLSAYEADEYDAEILLGYAMQILHETPVLDRAAIRAAFGGANPAKDSPLAPSLKALGTSGLAEQAEQIKIAPHRLDVDEMSKLWTAFQAKYRPSVAYHVSVVLIESTRPVRSALPVLSRGHPMPAEGRDEGVAVQPDLLPAFPTLFEVTPPSGQPAFRMSDVASEVLRFAGHHLDGGEVVARFAHIRSRNVLEVQAAATPQPTATGFSVALPTVNLDHWQIGVYGVWAAVKRSGAPERTTSQMPLSLAPLVVSASVEPSADGKQWVFKVACTPKVWKGQSVVLVVGEREVPAEALEAEKVKTLTFRSDKASLPAGDYWLRLRVDDIESLLIDRTKMPPVFNESQKVTIS